MARTRRHVVACMLFIAVSQCFANAPTAEELVNKAKEAAKKEDASNDQLKAIQDALNKVSTIVPDLTKGGAKSGKAYVDLVATFGSLIPPPAGPVFAAVGAVIDILFGFMGGQEGHPAPLTTTSIQNAVEDVVTNALQEHDVKDLVKDMQDLNGLFWGRIRTLSDAQNPSGSNTSFKELLNDFNANFICQAGVQGIPGTLRLARLQAFEQLQNVVNKPGPINQTGTDCPDDVKKWDSRCGEWREDMLKSAALFHDIATAHIAFASTVFTYYQNLNRTFESFKKRPDYDAQAADHLLTTTWKFCLYEQLINDMNSFSRAVTAMSSHSDCSVFFSTPRDGDNGGPYCDMVQDWPNECNYHGFLQTHHADPQCADKGWTRTKVSECCCDRCGHYRDVYGGYDQECGAMVTCSRCKFAATPHCVHLLQSACGTECQPLKVHKHKDARHVHGGLRLV